MTADLPEQPGQCAACGGSMAATAARKSLLAHSNGKRYTLYLCPRCEIGFWWPLQADPSIYVDEGFDAYKDYHSGTRPFPRWAEPLFDALPDRRGAALDIGCGDGSVLRRLSAQGFAAYGIDLDPKSVAIARDKYGLENVLALTLTEWKQRCDASGTRFDLITFFEVLEHQDAPLAFLADVIALGVPGAMVAGSVPNRMRFLAPLQRMFSDGDLPPHHFLWFSKAALRRLLERAGLTDIGIDYAGGMSYGTVLSKLVATGWHKAARAGAARFALLPLAVLAPFAAAVLWLGGTLAPQNLFFRCRTAPRTH